MLPYNKSGNHCPEKNPHPNLVQVTLILKKLRLLTQTGIFYARVFYVLIIINQTLGKHAN